MDEDWQKETLNALKLKKNKIFFVRFDKKINIESRENLKFEREDLVDITISNRRLLPRNFKPDSKLDLHGMTQKEAFEKLVYFIDKNFYNHHRNLLVITGKGNRDGGIGMLKSNFNNWLNHENIRAKIAFYCQALDKYGGEGAFIILLKKCFT